ncbi:MAG TPA: fibronectin type III domain-containing protein [Propionibacteriaceae bacterium]|jgi:hypothetical protein
MAWRPVQTIAHGEGGAWVDAVEEKLGVGSAWVDVASLAQGDGNAPPPPPPPPTDLFMGRYSANPSGNPDQAYFATYGNWPMGAVTYIVDQAVNEAYEIARLNRGTKLFVDLDPKNTPGLLYEISIWSTAGQTYVDRFLTAMQRVATAAAAASPDIVLGFVHEWEVKIQPAQGPVFTDARDREVATFAAALSRFINRAAQIAPSCRTSLWTGGYFTSLIAQVMAAMTAVPDAVIFDEYVTASGSPATTPMQDWQPFVTFLNSNSTFQSWNGGRTPIYLGEYGIDTVHGDAACARFFSGVEDAMRALGIGGCMHFNRDRTDNDGKVVFYDISTGSTPLAQQAFAAEVASIRGIPSQPPAPPVNLRQASAPSQTTVNLAMEPGTPPADADPVTEYRVYTGTTLRATAPALSGPIASGPDALKPVVVPLSGTTPPSLRQGSPSGPELKLVGASVWGVDDLVTRAVTVGGLPFWQHQYNARTTIAATLKAWGANMMRFRLLADAYNAQQSGITKATRIAQIVAWRDAAVAQGLYFMPCWWDSLDGSMQDAGWGTLYTGAHQMMTDVRNALMIPTPGNTSVLMDDPMVIYELFNEPNQISDAAWQNAMQLTIAHFRGFLGYRGVLLIDTNNWSHRYDDTRMTQVEGYDAGIAVMGGTHQLVFCKHDYGDEYPNKDLWTTATWINNDGVGGTSPWNFTKHLVVESEFGNYNIDGLSHPAWSAGASTGLADQINANTYPTLVGAFPFVWGPWSDGNAMTATDNVTPTTWGGYGKNNLMARVDHEVATSDGVSVQVTGLTAATTYSFTARSFNGQESVDSAALSVTTQAVTGNVAPNAPANLRLGATGPTTSAIPLAWDAATLPTGAAPVTEYRIYEGATLRATVAGLTGTVTGLAAGTAHTFTVRAYNGRESTNSNAFTASTTASQPPAAPTSLRQTGVTSSSVSLAWNAATVPAGSNPITAYRVYRGATLAATVTGLTATASGLSASTAYLFTVRAFNGAESAASNTLSATTQAASTGFAVPAGYSLYHGRDFTVANAADDANWEIYTGPQGNNRASFRAANVVKSGTNGQELIANRTADGATVYSGAVKNYDIVLPQYFYLRYVFKLMNFARGSWPSLWARPHPTTGGEGEIDFMEAFGGHIGSTLPRIICGTIILTPYSNGSTGAVQTNLPGQDWGIPASSYGSPGVYGPEILLEVRKTVGQVSYTVNGVSKGVIARTTSNAAKWDAQMERASQRWYVRLDHQAGGVGANGNGESGDPAPGWRESRQSMMELVVGLPA